MPSATNDPPYASLASAIVDARKAIMLTQGALASALGLRQQSVSRWEAGTHRPSIGQLANLASALELDLADLRELAGYAVTAAPRAPHLPFDSVAPEAFEQIVADLLHAQHPTAQVRIEGSRGHDQSGIDIRVTFDDDREWVVQCKQVERFGPEKVQKAVDAVEVQAERKVLALSRVATPKAAAVLRAHPGWQLWDKDDLSRMIRALPGVDQDRIVDTYFPGQRMALLGRRESGPWLTAAQFFAPFVKPGVYFNHEWTLQGREEPLAALLSAIEDRAPVTLLVAAGGMGKSRLLLAGLNSFTKSSPSFATHFLSAARDPSRESLEALGRGEKLLVVDDAHDRDGLAVIIEYAADPANRTRLLFATRPYGLQRLRNDLQRFGFTNPVEIELGRLPLRSVEAIVAEVLKKNDANPAYAEPVAGIAPDNPLIATMAARVVATGNLSVAQTRNHTELREMVVSKFADVIAGSVGEPADAALLRAMLELIAVMQPVHLNDRRLGELFEATTEFSASQATRALKILIRGGVVYKRGAAYRLMPDVLGDYLIDESCVEDDGTLTPFAEKVIASVGREQLEQVMVNLGRMDWRRNDGDPANSNLLDRAWARLDDVDGPYDPRFGAVRAVAMYQPRQALAYVQRHLHKGDVARELTPILRNIAYAPDYLPTVCRLLWEMGRDDKRPLGQHPNHPIRALAELCQFDEYKAFEFSEKVSDFAFDLIAGGMAWKHHYSPLDILAPLLSGVVEANRDHGRSISLSRLFLSYDFAWPLRSRVINSVIELLSHPDSAVAVRAGNLVSDTIRLPMGFGSQAPEAGLRRKYDAEFATTMARLQERVASGALANATLITIAQAVEWHARYMKGNLRKASRAILAALPDTLEFRLRAALVEGAQRAFRGQVDFDEWSPENPWLDALVLELKRTYGSADAVLVAVANAMGELSDAGLKPSAAHVLVAKLVDDDLELAECLVEHSHVSDSVWRPYAFSGIRELLDRDPERGRVIVGSALAEADADPHLAKSAASTLGGLRRALDPADITLLRNSISSPHEAVVIAGLNAVQWNSSVDHKAAFELLMLAPFGLSEHVLTTAAHLLHNRNRKLFMLLGQEEVDTILNRIRDIPALPDDHWAGEMFRHLAEQFPLSFARFLLDRADRVLANEENDIDLLGYRFHDGKLGFHKSPQVTEVLAYTWSWLLSHGPDDGYIVYRAVEIFACMFDINARPVIDFFDLRLDTASATELGLIGRLVRHSHHFFAFAEQPFVERLLDRVAHADPAELEHVRDSLCAAALSGVKSGVRGEPMPRDLEAKAKAEAVLSQLSRFSPAWPLYETILTAAERDIARARREGEILDELE